MSNKLEGFVKDNKKEFEVKGPSDKLWAKIEAELDKKAKPKKSIKMYQWMSIAAMLVVSLGLYFTYNYKQANNIDVADINPEFGKREVSFVSQIEEKRDSLAIYESANPDLYKKFTEDLKNLDTEYERLKAGLAESPDQLFVVREMVKNREMQLQVLKQQLMIINQVNQYNKKENSI
jgi:septal ring factor EnvC (AmiA/AmiB activator)